MISKGLLSILAYSEKRREILLMLEKEPRTLQDIKDCLDVTSPEILPQLKKLQKNSLIRPEGRKYVLTDIGEIVLRSFGQLASTLSIFDNDIEFWKEHRIAGIPREFRIRINELGDYRIFKGTQTDMFKPHNEYIKNLLKSKWVMGVSPVLHPDYPKQLQKLAENGIPISIILTRDVLGKLKDCHKMELDKSFQNINERILICNENIELAFTVTDFFLSMRLFLNNGTYDFYNNIISYERSALEWGQDLFNYYERRSEIIIHNESENKHTCPLPVNY